MGALQHFEVKHIVSVQDGEVYRLRGFFRQQHKHWTADLAKGGMVGDSGAQPGQFGSRDVGSSIIAEQIAFAFQVSEESISRALVEARLLRNLA